MPTYGWAGPGKMREMEHQRTIKPSLVEPVNVQKAKENLTIFKCDLCDRKFKKAMMAARHFNSAHDDKKVDKDSWREYVKEA
jgi:uncharacterized C2H2 Zn-finger protein